MKRIYHLAISTVLVALLLSPLGCNSDDVIAELIEDVCYNGQSVLTANRTEGVEPAYDGGNVEGWFTLARAFVNVVKKENLPYDVIEDAVEGAGLPCDVGTKPEEQCRNETTSPFPLKETFQNFIDWWTPILIVSCVGVAVGVAFLVAGCVFWLCRCCGACRGGFSHWQNDCTMWTCTTLLLLCTLGLLSGVVLTFYSNQQAFDSLDSVRVSVNAATDHGVEFAEDLINDGIALFCLVIDTVRLSLQELEGLGSSLKVIIEEISSDVEEFLNLLEQNMNAIEASGETLDKVAISSDALRDRQQDIETALNGVVELATSVLEDCRSSGADCQGLPHPNIFTINMADYSMMPNVSNVSASVNRTLSEVNFNMEANQSHNNFSVSKEMIESNITMHLHESEMELERLNETVIEQRDNITNSTREILRRDEGNNCSDFSSILSGEEEGEVDLNAGYIQHCIIDQAFDEIKKLDAFRYGFGVAVSSLSLVIVALVLLGLLLGVLGWRPKKQPDTRTTLSHCAGKVLIVAVGVTYLFGAMVMVLSAFGFFFGSNAQKVCQSLEGPEYEGFANTVDNEELWGGSLLGTVVFSDPQKTLSLSQLLRNCEDDYAVYKAMNLSFLLDIRSDIINFTNVTEGLSREIFAAAESIQLTSDDIFSSKALQALIELNRYISNINIDSIQTELNDSQPALGFNVTEIVHNLTVYRNATANVTLQEQVDQLISAVESVSRIAVEIDTQSELLLKNITVLHTVLTTSSRLIEQANDIISYVTGDALTLILNKTSADTFIAISLNIDNFIQDLTDGLEYSIGRCRPLWGIYTELYIAVCYEVVDGLNGFWLSLGFCALFFIPVIVLSVFTSTCYTRHKEDTNKNSSTFFLDDPYSDYLMDDSSKRNSSMSITDKQSPSEDQV